MAVLIDVEGLTAEETSALLDVTQLVLDVVGVVEPTPFADTTSALIAIYRKDWWGGLLSGLSIVPYIGDLAKLTRVPLYVEKLRNALALARQSAKLRAPLEAVLKRLLVALRKLPLERCPFQVRRAADELEALIVDFLPKTSLPITRLEQLTEQTLAAVFGSTKHVGLLPRQNVRTIVEFFSKHGVNQAQWAELIKGIDLHAASAVSVQRFQPGTLVGMYVETARAADRQIGQWMTLAQGAVSHRNIGLSGAGREFKRYRVKEAREALKSKAAPAADHWTVGGPKPHSAHPVENGQRVTKPAEQVGGGGDQYFLPRAWEVLEAV